MLTREFVPIVAQMLLLGEAGKSPHKPYFTTVVIASALASFTGFQDQASIQKALNEVCFLA